MRPVTEPDGGDELPARRSLRPPESTSPNRGTVIADGYRGADRFVPCKPHIVFRNRPDILSRLIKEC